MILKDFSGLFDPFFPFFPFLPQTPPVERRFHSFATIRRPFVAMASALGRGDAPAAWPDGCKAACIRPLPLLSMISYSRSSIFNLESSVSGLCRCLESRILNPRSPALSPILNLSPESSIVHPTPQGLAAGLFSFRVWRGTRPTLDTLSDTNLLVKENRTAFFNVAYDVGAEAPRGAKP